MKRLFGPHASVHLRRALVLSFLCPISART
jgi:hypothetical protein